MKPAQIDGMFPSLPYDMEKSNIPRPHKEIGRITAQYVKDNALPLLSLGFGIGVVVL